VAGLQVSRWLTLVAQEIEATRLPGGTAKADLADCIGRAVRVDAAHAASGTIALDPNIGIDELQFDLVVRGDTEPHEIRGVVEVKWCPLGANTLHQSIWDGVKVALAVEDSERCGYLVAAAPAYFWRESSIPSIFEPGIYPATELLAQQYPRGTSIWEHLLDSGYAKHPDEIPSALEVRAAGDANINWSPVDWELRAVAILPRGPRLKLSSTPAGISVKGTRPPKSVNTGRAFERLVGELYRSLGYQVTHNVQLPGKQTDLIARRTLAGSGEVTLAIECKDLIEPVGNAAAIHFVATILKHQNAKRVTGGALISRSGFTADARAAAAGADGVVLLSWDELTSEALDVGPQIRAIAEDYEHAAIYAEYMTLHVAKTHWGNLTTPSHATTSSASLVQNWIDQAAEPGGATTLVILADFGAGKTTLVERVEYERAHAFSCAEDHRIPLRVPLRSFRETHDLRTMLRSSLRDRYFRDVPTEILWEQIERGRFYVLLDGFDEMIDRSDAGRRAELFHALLPVLRSPCPTLLTSRPSYFLEEGELEDLLASIRTTEREIAVAVGPVRATGSAAGDRVRRRLVNRRRETQPPGRSADPFGAREVEVAVLMPLSRSQVEAYIASRAPELAQVGASPDDVVDFIDRTYDLADLASRPLLLTLIFDSVLHGVLDVADTTTRYGASELYEIYTQAKLDIDLTKGPLHQRGLSLDVRCHLVERIALEMYKAESLEVDLPATLSRILAEEPDLERNGLNDREIATDFATCTFVTVADNGGCRFVHKSFRGFFVARAISKAMSRPHALLQDWLEQEVLYFLGGFGPTRPHVTDGLWARFLHADQGKRALRRNLLVAYLYTSPEHDSRKISGGEIGDAKYGRLRFESTRLNRVKWSSCEVTELSAHDGVWKGVTFENCQIRTLALERGSYGLDWDAAWGETLDIKQAKADVHLEDSRIDAIQVDGGTLQLRGEKLATVGALKARDSNILVAFESGDAISEVKVDDGVLEVTRACTQGLSVSRSIVVLRGMVSAPPGWNLMNSLIRLATDPDAPRVRGGRYLGELDEECILVADEPFVVAQLGEVSCGVFGRMDLRAAGRASREPACWGVLDVGELPGPQPPSILRLNRLILVSSLWRTAESKEGGVLHPFAALTALGQGKFRGARPPTKRLQTLMEAARAAYRDLFVEAEKTVQVTEEGALEIRR